VSGCIESKADAALRPCTRGPENGHAVAMGYR